MFENIISAVTTFIIQIISVMGYMGVGFIMAIQTMAIPLPSEIIIPFAGSLVAAGRFNFWSVVLTGAAGSVVGGSIAYYIGYKGGRPLVEKYGKVFFVSGKDLSLAQGFLQENGSWAVFFGMCLPVFRSIIALPAGVLKMKFWKFAVSVFLGSLVWCLLLAFLGMKLGANWVVLREKFHGFDTAIIILIILAGIWWIRRHFKHARES